MKHINEYCDNNNTLSLRSMPEECKKYFLKCIPETLRKYNDPDNVYVKKVIEVNDIITKPNYPKLGSCKEYIKKLTGLSWVGNSCYIDSVLFALLSVQNSFVDEYILDYDLSIKSEGLNNLNNRVRIQNKIISIVNKIRNTKRSSCSSLRTSLKKFETAKLFCNKEQAEAAEFLNFILSIFDTDLAVKSYKTYGTFSKDDTPLTSDIFLTSETIDNKSSIVHFVPTFNIQKTVENQYYELRSFLKLRDDSGILTNGNEFGVKKFTRKISTVEMIDTPYLIFQINRLFADVFYRTKIIPNENITLKNLKSFILSSVVVYDNFHYTCYFRCGDIYYYYNDLLKSKSKITEIGDYNHLLKYISEPNVITNGVLYFYTKHVEDIMTVAKELNEVGTDFVEFLKVLDDSDIEVSESSSNSSDESVKYAEEA